MTLTIYLKNGQFYKTKQTFADQEYRRALVDAVSKDWLVIDVDKVISRTSEIAYIIANE